MSFFAHLAQEKNAVQFEVSRVEILKMKLLHETFTNEPSHSSLNNLKIYFRSKYAIITHDSLLIKSTHMNYYESKCLEVVLILRVKIYKLIIFFESNPMLGKAFC